MEKITTEELEKIIDQQKKLNKVINDIGLLEANKHAKLHELASVNEIIEEFKSQLEKKYGQVNINLEDGSYTEIEKQDV
jgi:hypothetical protein|tara:strand:+ start:68 stop:304 length:237 start_codon:yes stop_codon:yes gene_type:complete